MKAAVAWELGRPLVFEEAPISIPGPGRTLVKTAVNTDETRLDLARLQGAATAVNARKQDPATFFKKELGGAEGVLVTALLPKTFEQALGMTRRRHRSDIQGRVALDFEA